MDFFVSMVLSLTARSSLYAGALRYELFGNLYSLPSLALLFPPNYQVRKTLIIRFIGTVTTCNCESWQGS